MAVIIDQCFNADYRTHPLSLPLKIHYYTFKIFAEVLVINSPDLYNSFISVIKNISR